MFNVMISADSVAELKAKVRQVHFDLDGHALASSDAPAPAEKATRKQQGKPAAATAEPKKEEPAAEVVDATAGEPQPELTMTDVRSKLGELINLGEAGSKASIEIVAALDAKDEKGMPKAAAIKPAQFAECIAMVDKKIAELRSATMGVL